MFSHHRSSASNARKRLTRRQKGTKQFRRTLLMERLEDRWLLATWAVLNGDDSGAGSLREAIDLANANPGPDSIEFDIGSGGPQTIHIDSALPTITDPVVIDGTTQPGYVDSPIVEVDGIGTASPVLTIVAGGSGSTLQGLAMRSEGVGLRLYYVDNSQISGLDLSWDGDGTSGYGLEMIASNNNVIENLVARNRIHGLRINRWDGTHTTGELNGNTYRGNDFSGSSSWAISAGYGRGTDNEYIDNDLSGSTNGVDFAHIDGLTLTAESFDLSGIPGVPLRLYYVDNSQISGLDLSWDGDGTSGYGLEMIASNNNVIENLVARNRIHGLRINRWDGTHTTGELNGNTYRGNDFSGSSSWAIEAGYGRGTGNEYISNNLSGSTNGVSFAHVEGLTLNAESFDMTGIPGVPLRLGSVSNSYISGLDLSWNGAGTVGAGIEIYSGSDNTLIGLTLSQRGTGIRLENSDNVSVECTSILDNATGVYVVGSSSGIALNYSRIAGNSNGVANSAAVVNAEDNYWGAPTGPQHASNPGGTGDSYSGNVDAGPFLTRLPPCLNTIPVADAGPDQVLDQVGGEEQILVTLDGSGSYDPDGDPIVDYVWTGPFPEGGGTVQGVSPTVTLSVGASTVTLIVDDGYAVSAADTVDVTINRTTWYVDDDAPGDPAPNDNTVSDPDEDGSLDHPFDRIQEAIDVAANAHTVQVAAGTYNENLTWDTKDIDLLGAGAADTIVDAGGSGRVLTIANVPDTASVEGFTFTDGSETHGGGLYISNSSLTVQNNAVSENTASRGGGIYLHYGIPVLTGNTIEGNLAYGSSSHGDGDGGGGIFSWWSRPLIANNVIAGNTTRARGGAIWMTGNEISQTIVNNTIVSNSAQIGGGGIYAGHRSHPLIANNIVAFNSSGIVQNYAAHPTLRYNNFYGNTAYDYVGVSPGEGDISADPRLASVRYGDAHIQPDSPCVDAGDDSVLLGPWLDMDGQARIQGDHVDIGADESDGTVWTVTRPIVRVATDGDDANDGSSWALAKQTVQAAIDQAVTTGGEVWVEAGIYEERITLPQYVFLDGGFDGSEANQSERDWRSNTTVLDGQSGGTVVTALQAGHLLNGIDGFTIRNGSATSGGGIYALDSSPLIENNVISDNSAQNGGGIHLRHASPVITGNTITSNLAHGSSSHQDGNGGGGIHSYWSWPLIANNVISGNTTRARGGAIWTTGNEVSQTIVNNTIVSNSAQIGGGAIYAGHRSYPFIANNIVAFNSSGIVKNYAGHPTLRHNNFYGNTAYDYGGVPAGEGDISADPELAGVRYGEVHIQPDSPCVDAGDDSAVRGPWLDIDGQARIQGEHVDIGADESDGAVWTLTRPVVRVATDGNDANDGSSWGLSKQTIQAAIDQVVTTGGEVWVEAGLYEERITLPQYVFVYGGFDGTEDARPERDWDSNTTVIDGQDGGTVVTVPRVGHLLNGIDGFTIQHGSATYGGGIYTSDASPLIENNTILENTASQGGGIYLAYGSPVIVGNRITDNLAYASSSHYDGQGGGGICSRWSSPLIANNVILGNTTRALGGGIYFTGNEVSLRIVNNTIVANSAQIGGGAIYVGHRSYAFIANNTVAFNSSGMVQNLGASPTLRHNNVYGNTAYDYRGLSAGVGDISADPKLAGVRYGDVHIQADSPCVDAGDDSVVRGPWLDMDGQARIQGSHVDIGADESDGAVWTLTRPVVRVATDGNDANDGSSWGLSKQTIQAAIDQVVTTGGEVWVEAGLYEERITLPQYVFVYGGFDGTEDARPERDWDSNTTVIDGQDGGTVVTVPRVGHLLNGIDGFTIQHGSATYGGGIYTSDASPLIENNTILENTASQGGGIYLAYGSPVIVGNRITDNLAYATSGHYDGQGGGGICSRWSWPLIANNVILGNTTRALGGGIYFTGNEVSQTIVNNTIVANTAQIGGGGIYVGHRSRPLIANNILAFNSSGIVQRLGASPTLRHNNVYGNTDYDYGGISPGEGDVSVEPGFVDQPAGDLHLTRESRCVDAGDDSVVNPEWVDMDGGPRIEGDHVDIGADEFVPNVAPTADAGGPYAVVVGLTIAMDGSGSSDPDQPAETLIYEWDLDADGIFGETGQDAAQGDETGITPMFSSAGLSAPNSLTVTLRVTDNGELVDEDMAQIEIYGADLTLNAWDISFAPVNPDPGDPVLITATISNQGVADASEFDVNFLAFDDSIGTATIPSLAAGQSDQVFIQTQFDTAGLRLISVRVDAGGDILELNEDNNQASAVLQVGIPTGSDEAEIVVDVPAQTAHQGRPKVIGGRADYDFIMTTESADYPVQGGQVTVTVKDSLGAVLGVYTGAKTRAGGGFAQGILAPVQTGTYTLLVEVTDNTVTGQFESTLDVIEEPSLPPIDPPPPPPPGGPTRDVSVYSDSIFFTNENPDLGEPIDIFAFVGYVGSEAADNVAVTVNDIFPVAGHLMTFPIGTTFVDFPASPGGTNVAVTIPWTNTSDGAHIIQAAVDPAFAQFTGNDRASRLIQVGSPIDTLTMSKNVALAFDADGNGIPTPGDTLGYTISFENTGTDELTGAVILDDFDEALLQAPSAISDGGTVVDGTILWDLGPIAGETSGSVTYQVDIKPPAQFPGGITTVVNATLLDTDQTAPIAATAEIEVTGDIEPPTTSRTVTPGPNGNGWNNTDVALTLTAADNPNPGASGVSEIVYSINGESVTTVPGDTVTLDFTDEGIYTVAYHAVDVALNVEATETIDIKIDKTAPVPVHGGPFFVDEGDTIDLDGTGSTDALSKIDSAEWSFDDDDPATFVALDGPSTHDVSLEVTDMAGNVAIAYTQIHVLNVDPTPSITEISEPRLEGTEIVVTGSAIDPAGPYDILTYNWTVEKDGVAFANASGVDLTEFHFTPDDNADYRVVLKVSDEDGGSKTVEQTITVANVAPTLVLQPVLSIVENGVATLTGTISDPGVLDTFTLDVNWGDLLSPNNVQQYTFDPSATGSQTFTLTHRYLDDNPSDTPRDTYTISATVTDDDSGSVSEDTTVEVTNFVPAVDALVNESSTCGNVVEGQGISIEVSFTDHGTLDTHKVVVDWGEGKAAETFDVEPGARGWTVGHVYESGGIYDVAIKVTDDDTGSSQEVPTTVIVTGAGINDRVLQIVGTPEDDHVSVNQQGNGRLKVHADFLPNGNHKTFEAGAVDSIYMMLCAGNDHATVAGSIEMSVFMDGGPGDDHLNGGGGSNILLGGGGNDHMIGGGSRDILIGGSGADRLVGGPGDDILIAGWTLYDSNPTTGTLANDTALLAILDEWNSTDDFTTRQARIDAGIPDNDEPEMRYFLRLGESVFADGDLDTLTGSSGEDWFFADGDDDITGSQSDDDADSGSTGNDKGKKRKK